MISITACLKIVIGKNKKEQHWITWDKKKKRALKGNIINHKPINLLKEQQNLKYYKS